MDLVSNWLSIDPVQTFFTTETSEKYRRNLDSNPLNLHEPCNSALMPLPLHEEQKKNPDIIEFFRFITEHLLTWIIGIFQEKFKCIARIPIIKDLQDKRMFFWTLALFIWSSNLSKASSFADFSKVLNTPMWRCS